MKTRMKLTAVQKYEKLALKLSNPNLIKELIAKYQNDTKNAVKNILNMCLTVKELHEKVKSKELTATDLDYFCTTVSLDKDSSTFRKYLCIADKAEMFEKYLERVPASYTILYEITTLDADQFDLLIESKQLNNFITLKEVKKISGKQSSKKANTVTLRVQYDNSTISKQSLQVVRDCFRELIALSDVTVDSPDKSVFLSNPPLKKAA